MIFLLPGVGTSRDRSSEGKPFDDFTPNNCRERFASITTNYSTVSLRLFSLFFFFLYFLSS